jgi:SLOG cluster2
MTENIVAISVSDGPDLQLFGFLPQHLRRLFASLAAATLRNGWRIGYGGDLRRDGFTRSLLADMGAAFGRGEIGGEPQAAVVHFFSQSSWGEMPAQAILNHLTDKELGPADAPIAPVVETRFLMPRMHMSPIPKNGSVMDIVVRDGELRFAEHGERLGESHFFSLLENAAAIRMEPAQALTAMRREMAAACPLRIQFSGKIDGYAGEKPGLVEEAIEQIRAGGIVMPLGAFGGAAREIAIALGLLKAERTHYPKYGRNYQESFEELQGLAQEHERQAREFWLNLVEAAEVGTPHRIVFNLNAVLAKMLQPARMPG